MLSTSELKRGMKDGVPILLGYFSVSIAFGIQASKNGLSPLAAMVMSLSNLTSAGQFAALDVIKSAGSLIEMALTTLLINLRYLLMSSALSQKLYQPTHLGGRLIASFGVTDEIFGISVMQSPLHWEYTLGAMLLAIPGWVGGTAVGAFAGALLPDAVRRALGVALYAMFMGVVLPPCKKERALAILVPVSMLVSWLFVTLFPSVSSGFRIIILAVLISGAAAAFAPVKEGGEAA
ncbi:MAG: AzlC family ABC transporter permease [Clostridia bacterium]|nr:AzlC family ABC transporter permease [Clostridia bacterium]